MGGSRAPGLTPLAHTSTHTDGLKLKPLRSMIRDVPGSTTAADRAQHRVLIVDDEVQIAKCLRRLLIRAGFEVAIAFGPHEALGLLDEFQPDLVLSDFRMPRMNGAELLSEVQRRAPLAVRVIASGCADVDAVSAGLEVGLIGCVLSKPWNDGDLVSELRRLLSP